MDECEDVTVEFINTKVTNDITVKKKVEVPDDDINRDMFMSKKFTFTVVLAGLKENATYTAEKHPAVQAATREPIHSDQNGEAEYTTELSHDEYFKILDLPDNATYRVIEGAAVYMTASCKATYNDKDNGKTELYSIENDKANTSLNTGERGIVQGNEVEIVFTNRKISCDITVKKLVDMTNGHYTEDEYKTHDFVFDVSITGLDASGKKYSELIGEFTREGTTGSIRTDLAALMELEGDDAEAMADSAVFSITLHHGESFKLKELPFGAEYSVTERRSRNYIASYVINSNDDAVLQTIPSENTVPDKALSLNVNEIIDADDKNIEYIFTNTYDFVPYTLPSAGMDDIRPLAAALLGGMIFFAAAYWFITKKYKHSYR